MKRIPTFLIGVITPLLLTAQNIERGGCMPDITTDATHHNRVRKNLTPITKEWESTRVYKHPVVLINFKGDATYFTPKHTVAYYDSLFNAHGFNERNGKGCIADYFREQSNGLFNLKFDIFGPYEVSQKAQRSEKPNEKTKDYNKDALREALNAFVAEQTNLDFSQYDWDGDKNIEQVIFVYAGTTGNINHELCWGHIWPHSSTLSTVATTSGYQLSRYTCCGELWPNNASFGIGTICHEYSHFLGLPDLYPVNGWQYSAVDEWDLMDGGNFTNYGWCPPNYSPFLKMMMGWAKPIELTKPTSIVNLKPISQGGEFYRISHTDQEFYLLENRQWDGWDAGLPGKGLVIYHVNYVPSEWYNNNVNDTEGQLHYELVNADDLNYNEWDQLLTQRGLAGSPYQNKQKMNNYHLSSSAYPCITDSTSTWNDSLTNTSVPASVMITKNAAAETLLSKAITDIRMTEEGLISFNFMGGDPAILEVKHPKTSRNPALCYLLDGTIRHQTGKKGIFIIRKEDGEIIKFIR